MKKSYLLILFLLIPLVFAQELELNKHDFQRGETIIADINTKYPLTSELTNINAHILGSNNREISAPFYVTKLTDSKYILYMTIPNTYLGTNYTLRLDNVYYYKDGILEHFVVNEPFTITSSSMGGPLLSVDPAGAYIDLSKEDYFYLTLKNTGDEKLDINLKYGVDIFDVDINSLSLYPGDSKKLTVHAKKPGENIIEVNYNDNKSSYSIKVFVEGELPYDTITQAPGNALSFTNIEGTYTKNINENQVEKGIIRLRNNWGTKLTNLKVAVSSSLYGVVSVTPNVITSIAPRSQAEISVSINEDKNIHADYSGSIVIESDEGATLTLPIQLYYIPTAEGSNQTEQVIETTEETSETVTTSSEQENNMKLGTVLSLIAILFVIIVSIILAFKLKKSKPRRKKF